MSHDHQGVGPDGCSVADDAPTGSPAGRVTPLTRLSKLSAMRESNGGSPSGDSAAALLQHAVELYDDVRLMPLLRKLVKTSCQLADAMGGSISIVDVEAGRYTKVAEFGTACRLGQTFPLHEGVTGHVMSRRAPVVLETYRQLATGHLVAGHPARDGAVAALPVWWRDEIVAVNVIFAGVPRPFSMKQVDHLELVTQFVAPGVVTAMDRELPGQLRVRRARDGQVEQADPDNGRDPAGAGLAGEKAVESVDDVVRGLVGLAERAALEGGCSPHLDVKVVAAGRPRLLVRHDPAAVAGHARAISPSPVWHELVDDAEGAVVAHPVTERGAAIETLEPPGPSTEASTGERRSPFSSREQQVADLLARGLSDRAVAEELCLSPKTVEKHVSAVLRKTGTTRRTAAVVRCIENGWL